VPSVLPWQTLSFSAHRRGGSFFLAAKRSKNCRLIFFYESMCSGSGSVIQKIPRPVKSKTEKQWFGCRNRLRAVYYFTHFSVTSVFPWQFACFLMICKTTTNIENPSLRTAAWLLCSGVKQSLLHFLLISPCLKCCRGKPFLFPLIAAVAPSFSQQKEAKTAG